MFLRISCCNKINVSISLAFLSHLISGCRLITPVPEQGTSSKMRSKGSLFHQVSGFAASAAITWAVKLSLSRFSCTLVNRVSSISTAVTDLTLGVRSRIWHVFPPGAAQQSRTVSSGCASSKRAAWCAAPS